MESCCQRGVALHRPTKRGCRGGAHIQRHIAPIVGYRTASPFVGQPDIHQHGVNNSNIRRICLMPIAHQDTRKATKLGLLNARSLRGNSNILCDYVLEHDIDMLCLTDTWLTPNDEIVTQAIIPQGYIIEHIPCSTRRRGGVGVLFNNTIRLESAKMWDAESFECVEVVLFGSPVASAVRLFVLYRQQSSGRLSKPFALFLQEFGDLIIYTTAKQSGLAILGDFNVPYGKANNKDAGDLATLISDSHQKQNVLSATHVRGNTLDLIITAVVSSVITDVTVDSLLSDHHVILCRLPLPKPRPVRKQIRYRRYGAIDNYLFECDLLASSFVTAPVGNTQTQCEQFIHELSTIMDKHAPMIRQTINVRPIQPWRTDDLQSMRRDVRRAERKWRLVVRDAFKKGIATAKSTYYCGEIESSANHARKMFRVAGDLMGRSRLPLAPNGDDSAADPAERFSAHYVAKITQLHYHLTVASVPSHPPLPAEDDECSVAELLGDFQPATVETIRKLSLAVSNKVCPRIDVLTTVLLKSHMTTLAPVLTRLVNSSIESSTVPAAMKHAIITQLLNNPCIDVDNMSSYRPISKLSFVSKVLEKHIAI